MVNEDYVAKIEGHGKLKINFDDNIAKLEVDEGERFFEALVLGRSFRDVPFIVSRICGVCPTAHYLASIKALEDAMGVTPPGNAIILRNILLMAQISQSHILHAFFLALPDYIGVDNIFAISKKYPSEFKIALKIKKLSDKIVEIVGGRAVHPTTPTVGGFHQYPEKKILQTLKKEINNTLNELNILIDFFAKLHYPELYNETQYLTLSHSQFPYYDGLVITNGNAKFLPKNYKKEIQEEVVKNSSAKVARFKGKPLMVGAIARLSINKDGLNNHALKRLNKFFDHKEFPSYNPFHNNFLQVVEIMHSFEEIIKLIDSLNFIDSLPAKSSFRIKSGEGVGAIEAPRGTLYHYYKLDRNGIVMDCDIITPTVQNLANLEIDAKKLLAQTKSLSNKKRSQLLEMLVRAYDPCLTCSVH